MTPAPLDDTRATLGRIAVLEARLADAEGVLTLGERVELLTTLVTLHESRDDLTHALAAHRRLLEATLRLRDEAAEDRARTIVRDLNRERERARARAAVLRAAEPPEPDPPAP